MTRCAKRRSIFSNWRSPEVDSIPSEPQGSMSSIVGTEHPKIEHRLENGDVLIVPSTQRDPQVDAAFRTTVERVREQNRARFDAFRQAQAKRS